MQRMFAAFKGDEFRGIVRWRKNEVCNDAACNEQHWLGMVKDGFNVRPVIVSWTPPKSKAKRKK